MPEVRNTGRGRTTLSSTAGSTITFRGSGVFDDFIIPKEEEVTSKEGYVITRDAGQQKLEKCVLVENSGYYLKTSKYIFKDDLDGSYQLNDYKYRFLIRLDNGNPIMGNTHNSNTKSMPRVELSNGDMYHINDIESAINSGFIENRTRGIFMHNTRVCKEDNDIDNITYYETFGNIINKRDQTLPLMYKTGSKSPSYSITEGIKYTFGVELEVCNGNIPKWLAYQKSLNISCVRDGSIRRDGDGDSGGAEYVTGVLIGDTGITHLQEICSELTKRTRVNKTCGKMYATL